MSSIDFQGAFTECPIPTLIIEGTWDLTWNTDKPEILYKNHPGSKLVMFEKSGHNPFEDEPDKFFPLLKEFIENLPEIPVSQVNNWKNYIQRWKEENDKSPEYLIRTADWGKESNIKIVKVYKRELLSTIKSSSNYLMIGFALYDVENYEEALYVFKELYKNGEEKKNPGRMAVALIWQGHMLDLLGKRDEAISRYQKVIDMNVEGGISHSQFDMVYYYVAYAQERLKEPFKRIENKW